MANKRKAVKKLSKKITSERERVLYSFEPKTNIITAQFKNKKVVMAKEVVKELTSRLGDLKRFYSFCNADIKLLARLGCDAQAKKQGLVKNTQYDSRKKLFRLLQQVALTGLKQKTKKGKVKAKAKAKK